MSEEQKGPRLDRARRYHDEIAALLMRAWDPIGVAGIAEAQDEYDAYVGEVYGMLIRHEPRHKLVDYLWWAETENMALRGSITRTNQVVDGLLKIRDELEGSC